MPHILALSVCLLHQGNALCVRVLYLGNTLRRMKLIPNACQVLSNKL